MLKIRYKSETYAWPLDTDQASFSAFLNLSSEWLEEQNTLILNLGASGEFVIPPSDYKTVTDSDLFFMESLLDAYEHGQALPKRVSIPFELSLYFTQVDPDDINRAVLSGVISKFMPDPRDLQDVEFSDFMVKDARLWLGNELNAEPKLTAIKFGKIKAGRINLFVSVEVATQKGLSNMEMDMWLPLHFYFRAGVYSDDFEGLSRAERLKEIRDCFSTFYTVEDYDLEERIINEAKKEVMTRFVLKSTAS